jgi:putative ABC transport system permease protein
MIAVGFGSCDSDQAHDRACRLARGSSARTSRTNLLLVRAEARQQELAVRAALGAQLRALRRTFLSHGILLTVGVTCGLMAALALMRVTSSLLFEVSPTDPFTYTVVSSELVAAAALASHLPAHRATAVDPVEALRAE